MKRMIDYSDEELDGRKVRIKSWDRLCKEFSNPHGSYIDFGGKITSFFKHDYNCLGEDRIVKIFIHQGFFENNPTLMFRVYKNGHIDRVRIHSLMVEELLD